MRITEVRCFQLTGRGSAGPGEERSVQMLDVYPDHARAGAGPGGEGTLTQAFVQIATDEGVTGLFGPMFVETAFIIRRKLAPHLVGQDPLAGERLWDVLYRQDRHARRGYEMMAISAVDCALWDLRGKVMEQPVYRLLGGPTRGRVDCYYSMIGYSQEPERVRERARWAVAQGYRAQKWFFRYGPTHGLEGMARNVELVRTVREAVGPTIEIMLDGARGWDASYAIRLLERIEEYHPRWLEEPVTPDLVDDFARIRRTTRVPIATGEHEYNRWGALHLLKEGQVDVLQCDPDWCGGISELVKICTLASAFGRHVCPHGHSLLASVHVLAAQSPAVAPIAEFVSTQPGKQTFFRRYIEPVDGAVPLPTSAGLGIDLDESKADRREEIV